jgi:hypothetical protein
MGYGVGPQNRRAREKINMATNNDRAPWVPGRLPDAERAADIAMIKKLAEDLSYNKVNYPATLESIVLRARKLFDEEALFIGRGESGPAKKCRSCDGIYVKDGAR